MILQGDSGLLGLISISEIIGGAIATIFAVASWYIVNKLSALKEWKEMTANINELYDILSVDKYYPDMSIDLVRIIVDDLGEYKLTKYLKLKYHLNQGLHYFEGNDFQIVVMTGIAGSKVELMQYGKPIFNYYKPQEGAETKENLLNFIKSNCRKAGIKIQ